MSRVKIKDLKPKFPFVFTERLPAQTQFEHLMIVLPDEQNYRNRQCRILAVHGGRKHDDGTVTPCSVKPGQIAEIILFDAEETFQMEDVEGKTITVEMCREDNILAYYE